MANFTIHTRETAPEGSKDQLAHSQKNFGLVPNLHGVMAESPQHLEAYRTLHKLFQEGAFTPIEQDVVWLTINVLHNCHYCVPAHTAIAKGKKTPDAVIDALREGRALPDAKLEALRTFTTKIVKARGEVTDADFKAFYDAGYTNRHYLDLILGLAQKVMSNYVNHAAHTPIDPPFAAFDWTPATAQPAQAAE